MTCIYYCNQFHDVSYADLTFNRHSYPFCAAFLTPRTDDSFQASGMAQAPPCTIIQGRTLVGSVAFLSSIARSARRNVLLSTIASVDSNCNLPWEPIDYEYCVVCKAYEENNSYSPNYVQTEAPRCGVTSAFRLQASSQITVRATAEGNTQWSKETDPVRFLSNWSRFRLFKTSFL